MLFSSASRKRHNNDGTWNIYCYSCGRFIAITTIQIGKTQCELCRREEAGEEMTEEMVRAYNAGKLDRSEISYLDIPLEPEPIKALGSKMRTMGAGIIQAVGLAKKPAVSGEKSKAVAQERQRGRVFDNPDALGSLEELDNALNRSKERSE